MVSVIANDPAKDLLEIEPFWTLGLTFLTVPVATLCLNWLALLLKLPCSAIPFWLSVSIASVLLVFRLRQGKVKHVAIPFLLLGFWLYLAIAVRLSSWLLDTSWDGLTYHQEYIILLRHGWNPLWENANLHTSYVLADWWDWKYVYTKGAEIVASSLYAAFNHIEAAKAIHWIWNAASFFISWCFFVRLTQPATHRHLIASVAALIAALNPVSLCQLSSFYVDGDLASGLLCLFSAFGLILMLPSLISAWFVAAFVMVYLINLKIYCLGYVGVMLILSTVALFRINRDPSLCARLLGFGFAAVAAGLVVGFNPYLIKCTSVGDCFYPFKMAYSMTERTQVREQPPGLLITKLPVGKLVLSIFSRTSNEGNPKRLTAPDDSRVKIMPPFFIDQEEFSSFRADTRIGGFGPWFGEILVIAFFVSLFFLALQFRGNADQLDGRSGLLTNEQKIALWFAIIALVLTIANPISWWARYVPQLWLVPIFLVTACFSTQPNKRLHMIASGIALLVLVDISVVNISSWHSDIARTIFLRNRLHEARNLCRSENRDVAIYAPFTLVRCLSVPVRLAENGISCHFVDKPPEPNDQVFPVVDLPVKVYLEKPMPASQFPSTPRISPN